MTIPTETPMPRQTPEELIEAFGYPLGHPRREAVLAGIKARETAIATEAARGVTFCGWYADGSPVNGGPHAIVEFETAEQARAFYEWLGKARP